MSKKRPGGKKPKSSSSRRPPAPSSAAGRDSVAPASRDSVAPASADARDSSAPDSGDATAPRDSSAPVAAEGAKVGSTSTPSVVAAPPAAPDTLAPISTGDQPEGAEIAAKATEPDATPAAVVVDAQPARASAPKLRDEERSSPSRKAVTEDDIEHHDFFAGAEAAVEKMHAEVHRSMAIEEEVVKSTKPRVTREMLERRDRLRRVVLGVVAVAGLASVVAGVRLSSARKASDTSAVVATVTPPPARPEPAAVAAKPVALPTAHEEAARAPEPKGTEATSPADGARPADSAKPADSAASAPADSAKPTDAPAPADSAKAAADPTAAKALTKEALRALEMGKYAAAIESATKSVAADPSDANAYLYWGTALMEQGKRADAKKVFAQCVDAATRGPKHECKAFK